MEQEHELSLQALELFSPPTLWYLIFILFNRSDSLPHSFNLILTPDPADSQLMLEQNISVFLGLKTHRDAVVTVQEQSHILSDPRV